MNALTLTNQKIWPMLKYLWTNKGTDKGTVQKLFVPDLSKLGHETPFEGNKPPSFMTCHIWFITALVFGKFIDGYSLNLV